MGWLIFNNVKERVFFVVVTLYIVYIAFPIFGQFTGITEDGPALLVVMVCTILYPSALKNRCFYYTLLYFSVLLLYLLLGKPLSIGIGSVDDSRKLLIEAAWILPAVMLFCVMQHLDNKKMYKLIALVSIMSLFLSFLYLIPLISANYYLLREDSEIVIKSSGVWGMPSYALMHAYVYLIPALCYACKCASNKWKWLWIAILITFFYVIVHTYVTTSLFVSVVMILSALLYKRDSKNGLATFVVILIIVYCLYLLGAWSGLIEYILPWFSETAVEGKLTDIFQSLNVGHIHGGNLEGRMNYHGMSWSAFAANPIFGSSNVGGHSSLVDRLGVLGLFGFLPFAMIFISYIKIMGKINLTYSSKFFFLCSILTIFVFLYTKGLFGAPGWLFSLVIVPSMLLYLQEKEGESNQDIAGL